LGVVREAMVQIARSKIALDPVSALARGVLCNVLVCLAVWLCMGARSVTAKILATVFPTTAFVAGGFEHSVANMYLLQIGVVFTRGSRQHSQSLMRSATSRWSRLATSSAGPSSSRWFLVGVLRYSD